MENARAPVLAAPKGGERATSVVIAVALVVALGVALVVTLGVDVGVGVLDFSFRSRLSFVLPS